MVKKKLLSFVAFYASKYNRVSSYLWDVWRWERYFLSFLRESSGKIRLNIAKKGLQAQKKVLSNDNSQTDNKNDVCGQMERF